MDLHEANRLIVAIPKNYEIYIENPGRTIRALYHGGSGQLSNLQKTGIYRNHAGSTYDFRRYLKLYRFERSGEIHEQYAPSKAALRKSNWGAVRNITEVHAK